MVDKAMDEKHAERLLEAAKRAAKVLKENPPPDTFADRKTQKPFPKDDTD
jgi:hypothetical protein